jgi:hypothetical protein
MKTAKKEIQPEPRKESLADKAIRAARVQFQQTSEKAAESVNRIRECADRVPTLRLVKVTK